MNKDNIYQIIGYRGEYNEKVKRSIRILLKQNHPDHNGDIKIFKLINEVKKELESNNVSYKYDKDKYKDDLCDIDYVYCNDMILKLKKKLYSLEKTINFTKDNIKKLNSEYNYLYHENSNKNIELLNYEKDNNLNNIKLKYIIIVIILIITFIIMIKDLNIYTLIVFLLTILVLILVIKKVNVKDDSEIENELSIIDSIEKSKILTKKYERELLILKEEKTKIKNDLRFYSNIVKNK